MARIREDEQWLRHVLALPERTDNWVTEQQVDSFKNLVWKEYEAV